jgi:hypothetical protein
MVESKQLKINSTTNCNRMLRYTIACICLVYKVFTALKSGEMNRFCVVEQIPLSFPEDCFAFEAGLLLVK